MGAGIASLSSGTFVVKPMGNPTGFDVSQNYSWKIMGGVSPVTGFNVNRFVVDASEFAPNLDGGLFSVAVDGNDLYLTFTTGSGNAPFYAFVELIPHLATSLGVNPAYLVIPMLQASNLGRTISPVSGVVVACAGMGNLPPCEVGKRTSMPVAVGLLVVILATQILVPA